MVPPLALFASTVVVVYLMPNFAARLPTLFNWIGAYTTSPGFMLSSDRLEPTDGYWPVVLMLSRMLNRRLSAVKVLLLDCTWVVKYARVPPPAERLSSPMPSALKSTQRIQLCALRPVAGMAATI